MHDSTRQLVELFAYDHLPPHLQEISKPFHDLAVITASKRTDRPAEQTTALRKLLEAKDCAVRMAVPRRVKTQIFEHSQAGLTGHEPLGDHPPGAGAAAAAAQRLDRRERA